MNTNKPSGSLNPFAG